MSPKSSSLKNQQQNMSKSINHEIAEKRKAVELQLRQDELIILSTSPT